MPASQPLKCAYPSLLDSHLPPQPPKKQAPASSVDQELIKSKSDAVLQNSLVRAGREPTRLHAAACGLVACRQSLEGSMFLKVQRHSPLLQPPV